MNEDVMLVSEVSDVERAVFYKKTYLHVAMAILSFIVVEGFLLRAVPEALIMQMISGKFIWLFIIGLFWLGSMLADKLAFSVSRNTQYLGLGLFVLLEAVIFLPILYIALVMTDSGAIVQQAAVITLFMFGGLTAVVFITKKDFSFLRSALVIGGFVALGLIVAGAIFGFNLGLWFSVAMVALAAGSILYQTSEIKNKYATGQYVGAALQLFSSVMLLFWYILRILMSRRD
ncbi:Bax inhibitor-1 family protein [Niabella sp. CJ426]|jgi:FtsH-binding integral membrane protein|uniref:Bax inhibitor-1/YccA family protein n=1 Tax=Niabella sp. CJ426 TaxID=3393740 RepID=UPI003CFFE941